MPEAQNALQTRSGVDRRLRQRGSGAVLGLIKLHEDEVPKFQEAGLGVGIERAAFGTVLGAAIDVDLAARTTRTGRTHLPEIVLVAQALDAILRHLRQVEPQSLGLIV